MNFKEYCREKGRMGSKKKRGFIAPPLMFSQRDNPYCESLQNFVRQK